jgi:hypothetical protein
MILAKYICLYGNFHTGSGQTKKNRQGNIIIKKNYHLSDIIQNFYVVSSFPENCWEESISAGLKNEN